MDRDSIFSAEGCRVLGHMGVRPMGTSFQSPWQNGVVERWVGTCRRELVDHVILLGEKHLRRLLREFVDYYPNDRTHLSLGKDPPTSPLKKHTHGKIVIPANAGIQVFSRFSGPGDLLGEKGDTTR